MTKEEDAKHMLSAIKKEIKETAKREGAELIPLSDCAFKSQKIGLRKNDPKKDINLEKIKNLKNTIYIPTIPSATNRVENDYTKLKNWDYWCIELNPQIIDAEYLSSWFNQKVPKMLLMNFHTSGSFMRRISSKDFENVHIIKHSLEQQKKFKENLKTVDKIVAKAEKLKTENVFDPKQIKPEEVIGDIPDLEFQRLIAEEESVIHEYKSSLRFNTKQKKITDWLVNESLKTIVAFLNTNGGHLVVGVDNNKKLIGIEIDRFASTDEWQRYLVDKIKTKIDSTFLETFIKIQLKKYDDRTVGIVKCAKIPYDQHASLEEKIFVRQGPSSRELTQKETFKWAKVRLSS